MNVLLTGGAGYVGSRVTAYLLSRGVNVTVFDRLVYGGQALLPFFGDPAFHLIEADVRDRTALRNAMADCDAVVHFAAIVGEAACDLDPAAAVEINRDAAIGALDLANSEGVKQFVFPSTCSNYGVSDPGVLADETTELRPLSLYAQTKVDVERAALSESSSTVVTVLRLGTICGLSARMRFDLLVSELARAAALGIAVELYKLDAWRPFLHVRDAARVVEHILNCDEERVNRRVFNVVGENYQKRGLAELVRRHFPDAKMTIADARPDNRDYRVSGARIKRELDFEPAYTVEDGFLEVAKAVGAGVFVDPFWAGHSAIPLAEQRLLLKA